MTTERPLRILTLDGGGVRGLSEVLILKFLMMRLKFEQEKRTGKKLPDYPEPWQYFDLICGTSTGGLLALMLGRLRMSVAECEAAYKELSLQVFGKEQSGKYRYDVRALEHNIQKVLQNKDSTRETKLFDERDHCCKTFVIAKRHLAHDSTPVLFRSYALDGTEIECAILEAARATSAAPTYFPETDIEGNLYVDGGIGYNNPADEAIREARRLWGEREIGCLVSIGAGLMEPISGATRTTDQFGTIVGGMMQGMAPLTAEKLTVAEYCTQVATSCQMVHLHLVEHPLLQKKTDRPRYYRFNVTSGMSRIGLQEASRLNEITQMTDAYIRDPERREVIDSCVELLHSAEALRAVTGLGRASPLNSNPRASTPVYPGAPYPASYFAPPQTTAHLHLSPQNPRSSTSTYLSMSALSLDLLEDENPDALELLNVLACFGGDDIPTAVLRDGATALPNGLLRQTLTDPARFDAAFDYLTSFSLVQKIPDGISIKSTIQEEVRRKVTERGAFEKVIESAICIIDEALPSDVFSVSTLKLHIRYQPHFLTCYNLAKKSAIRNLELAALISKALTYMRESCTYDLVYELAQTALSIRREYLGEKTYETTKSMIQLAQFYCQWLYYKEAETLLLRTKALRMALFGRVHKYIVETNIYLVELYQEWENHAEACRILNEELGNDMIPWGQMQESEEMRYVICRNWAIRINAKQTNAISRKDLSQMKECVEEWTACLKFYEDNFAADHPYIASVKCFLGLMYSAMPNALQQALRQCQQAKKILDNLDSPHIMAPVLCFLLAETYTSAGRTQEARQAVISMVHEARRMLGNVEDFNPHSYFVVLGDILVLLRGAVSPSDAEEAALEALANFDSWRGALDDTFKDISATDVGTVGVLVSYACQLRLQLATSQRSRRQYEEAITNYVRVIHEISQESPSSLPRTSGLSFRARLSLINLYPEACNPYFARVTIRDESSRYLCEVVAEMATIDFKDWWGFLGELLPVVNVSAMKMFNDPRKSGLQMNLQRIKDLAVEKDAELRKSQNDPNEAAVRQDLFEKLQKTLIICGVFNRNRYGLDSFKF